MSLEGYFDECIQEAKREITQKPKEYILGVKTEELAEYYASRFALPSLDVDFGRGEYDVDESLRGDDIPVKMRFPIRNEPGIAEVVKRESNPCLVGFTLGLEGDRLIVSARVSTRSSSPEPAMKSRIDSAKKQIEYKNGNVKVGNARIGLELKNFIEKLKTEHQARDKIIHSALERLPVKLERRSTGAIVVDFHVKQRIIAAMPQAQQKEKELFLSEDKVKAVVELLNNGARSFETTPVVYSKMTEEELRDILLGWLNTVFEGEATGETFSKLGKTDIHLRLAKGDILIVECKIWNGEKYLNDGIDQLFQYLTWRENFGVVIIFSKLRSFSEIVEKTKNVVTNHATYVKESLKTNDKADFSACHRFPSDKAKRVIVRYLLFNLYYES